jgi:hypothetical protein
MMPVSCNSTETTEWRRELTVLRPGAAGTTQGRTGGEGRLDAGYPGASDVPAKHQVARAGEDERGVGAAAAGDGTRRRVAG